jgi:hypothetical protein
VHDAYDFAASYSARKCCDAEVRVPQLPLDHDERDIFVRQLDRMSVP